MHHDIIHNCVIVFTRETFIQKKVNLKEYTLVLIFEVFIPGEEINCLKRQYCVRLVRIFVVIIDSIELYCIQHYYLCNLGVD